MFAMQGAHAQETVCARVKIEIKQKLTLERVVSACQRRVCACLTGWKLGSALQ
jgi:hypothetical protein